MKPRINILRTLAVIMTVLTWYSTSLFSQVLSVSPAQNALSVLPATAIQVTFNAAIDVTTFNDTISFLVTGRTSGRHRGAFAFSAGNTVMTFTPNTGFRYGEIVTVDVTSKIQTSLNVPITPFIYEFTTRVVPSAGVYSSKVDFETGPGPISVFVHDLDNDGDGDLAVVSNYSATGSISILKNNGDGTFAPKVDYPTAGDPITVRVSDLDGDGDGDLAVNCRAGVISVLKNNGDGTFAPKVDYSTAVDPFDVFISDLDGDGDGDLAVGCRSGIISILKNIGDGTFASR
jgi:hypothetical protein